MLAIRPRSALKYLFSILVLTHEALHMFNKRAEITPHLDAHRTSDMGQNEKCICICGIGVEDHGML